MHVLETLPMRIMFTVHGKPQPAGSKRAFIFNPKGGGRARASVVDANPKSSSWKTTVGWNAVKARNEVGLHELLDGPLRLSLVYEVPRPKSHIGKYGLPRASAPSWPTAKPDVLKLARAVEDALTGILYRDDSQIVHEELTKKWGATAVLHVMLETIEGGRT